MVGLKSKELDSCLTLTSDELSHMTSSAVLCNALWVYAVRLDPCVML